MPRAACATLAALLLTAAAVCAAVSEPKLGTLPSVAAALLTDAQG